MTYHSHIKITRIYHIFNDTKYLYYDELPYRCLLKFKYVIIYKVTFFFNRIYKIGAKK